MPLPSRSTSAAAPGITRTRPPTPPGRRPPPSMQRPGLYMTRRSGARRTPMTAARVPYGRIPRRTPDGDRLRATARLIALAGDGGGDSTILARALIANLVALAFAVTELRRAQGHAAQAAAARKAAEHMHAAVMRARSSVPRPGRPQGPRRPRSASAGDATRQDFPMPLRLDQALLTATSTTGTARPRRRHQPPTRAGPGR
jgi:hypothetical protein